MSPIPIPSRGARKAAGYGLCLLAIAAAPWLINAADWRVAYLFQVGCILAIYIVAAVSETVIAGFGGQLSFGQSGFMAVGAYATAILTTRYGVPWWVGIPSGIAAAVVVGAVLGTVTLRLRGPYFVMATLAFAGIVYTISLNWLALTRGPAGISNVPVPVIGPIDLSDNTAMWYFVWTIAIAVLLVTAWFRDTWLGKSLLAVRDDELAAGAIGIRTAYVKSLAFLFSAAIAGLSGATLAHFIGYVSPDTFSIAISVLIVTQVLVGGIDRISGAVLGVLLLTLLDQFLQGYAQVQVLLNGVVMLLAVLLLPNGLVGGVSAIAGRARARA